VSSLDRPLRVLLADDNLANQKLGKAMLEKLGCEVEVVTNGREAIRASTHTIFDLILMDCQMPEMDGYSATATIRAVEAHRGRRTPIIALTASAMQGDRERCLEAGMDDYLAKPLGIGALATAISRWQFANHVEPKSV
jgi:CheY-like chemotaxis protein